MNLRVPQVVPIAVVLATRNRAAAAQRAAASILRSAYPDFRLCIVDQSDDASTRNALRPFERDPRVMVIKTSTRGVAVARNLGISRCDSPLIAITDDDCVAAPQWLPAIAEAFAIDPAIGVIFGSVEAPTYDRLSGFIPAYGVAHAFTAHCLAQKAAIEGFGASMAIRRATWEALGGFDELMGTGSALRAGEDTDFAIRALIAGYKVHETPKAIVTHFGFRSWGDGNDTIAGYMFGLGAANAKMLRLGGASAWAPIARLAWRWVAAHPVADLNHLPSRYRRLLPFLRGAWRGLHTPLDSDTGHFVDRSDSSRARRSADED